MFDDLLSANKKYAETFTSTGLAARAARGLALLTCIDSRIDPLATLGLVPGEAKILRNAGARVTDDMLRSLAIAVERLGVNRIAVMAHTDCAAKTTDDELAADVELLRSTPLLASRPAVTGWRYDVSTGVVRVVVAP